MKASRVITVKPATDYHNRRVVERLNRTDVTLMLECRINDCEWVVFGTIGNQYGCWFMTSDWNLVCGAYSVTMSPAGFDYAMNKFNERIAHYTSK